MKATIEGFEDEIEHYDPIDELSAALSPPDSDSHEAATDVSIAPLAVSGLVITKAALIAALQIYMPQLVDLAPVDGERYYLSADPITTNQTNGETDA